MKYSFKFWSKILSPIDRVIRLFDYYIIIQFEHGYDKKDEPILWTGNAWWDYFDSITIVHKSKLKDLK